MHDTSSLFAAVARALRIVATAVTAGALLVTPLPAAAESVTVTVNKLEKDGRIGAALGTVTFTDHLDGLLVQPSLKGLSPGAHGTHIHQNPDCGVTGIAGRLIPGGAAGGHYDPKKTGRHEGPYGGGHLGDLPPLVAGKDGRATRPVFAPRLKVSDIRGRALIVHAGADNYADTPKKLGGGGSRVACAVIR